MASSPARVFAALVPANDFRDENELLLKRKPKASPQQPRSRTVEVTGSAEFPAPPDRAAVTVSVTSCKGSVHDVSNSVSRRLDYIVQSARQHGAPEEMWCKFDKKLDGYNLFFSHIQDGDIVVTKHIQRDGDLFRMQAEMCVQFSNFERMQCMRSVLIEKLDKSVCVGEPRFSHSSECLSLLRRRVCVAAVNDARLKASEVCSALGQALGRPLLIREEESREWTCGHTEGLDVPLTLEQKVGQTAVFASSRVFVRFELRPAT